MVDTQQEYRLSFFEVLTAMAYAAFADAPVDVAVVEVGMGGTWDATNVIDGDVAVVTPISLDHTDRLGETPEQIAGEKSGIIKKDATVVLAQQPVEAASVMLKRAVEVDATVAREGMEFGVLSREVAVGGQMLTLRGLGGEYRRSSCRCTARTRRTTPRWRSPRSRRSSASAPSTPACWTSTPSAPRSPRWPRRAAWRSYGAARPWCWTRRTTRPARGRRPRRSPRRSASAGWWAWSAASAGKDVRGLLEAFEPIFAEIVVTRNSSHRAMDADELAAVAVEVFGAERVQVEPRLDDALEAAITLAEEEGEYSGAGVLVTGSVITVGEARLLHGEELTCAPCVRAR